MSEMIERVKAALRGFEAGWLLDTGSVNPSGEAYETAKARAAIAAMREPTKTMLSDGYFIGGATSAVPPEDIWRAMIDAALT